MAKIADPARSEARKRHIRDAALRCFKRHGFHRAGMAEICAEAGMSPGNLYRYYQSKEAIIAAITEAECARYATLIRAALDQPDILDGLLSVAEFALTDQEALIDPQMALEIMAEAQRNPDLAEIVLNSDKAIMDDCTAALIKAQQTGQLSADLNIDEAMLVINSAHTGLMCHLNLMPATMRPAAISAYKRMMRRMLGTTTTPMKPSLETLAL